MLKARDLAAMPRDDLWAIPDGTVKVIFDDGVLTTTTRATILSAYMWKLYVRYPKTPALMNHHLGDARMRSNTHLILLNRVFWDCYDAYKGKVDIEDLCKITYESTNEIYNDFTYRLEEDVTTLSILDFIDVVDQPAIQKANSEVKATKLSIDHTYRIIEKVLKDPKELAHNPIANAAKNGSVSMSQIRQCVGPRGQVTDIDSNFFRDPILVGYVHGLTQLKDSMMESRSASKSLVFTEKPLQDSEYFNRQLQLLCDTLEFLHYGDCGSTAYIDWRVRLDDLRTLEGKYYLTKDSKGKDVLAVISDKDRHLINERIKIRSVLHCKHPDPRGVCSTCFGELAFSIPRETCLGHVCSTVLCKQVSQSVLSIKHVDNASGVDELELSEYDQQFLKTDPENSTIKLADRLENRRVILTVSSKEAEHLSDVIYVKDVRTLPVTRVSELSEIQLTIIGKKAQETVLLSACIGNRKGSLTHELLEYVKEHNWKLTATGNYEIDLATWDMDAPLFELPRKHENMLDYMASIERFIKASKSSGGVRRTSKNSKIPINKTLRDCTTLEMALQEFHTLVSNKLKVNIAHLEVILKCTMIRSSEHNDYRIPHEGNKLEFGSFNAVMARRSISVGLAFERQKKLLLDPASYIFKDRPSHPLDALFEG